MFLVVGFPQLPNDLKGRAGLARSRRHDEQDAVTAIGDRLYGGVDSISLVVARCFAAAIVKIILKDDCLHLGCQALPSAIACPQVSW